MGKTIIDNATLPKNSLQYNLPGGNSRPFEDFYNLPVPETNLSGDYQAWVAARKTKGFIFWSYS
jgi:hypothetical protein